MVIVTERGERGDTRRSFRWKCMPNTLEECECSIQEIAPIEYGEHVSAFGALNDVDTSCFGKTLRSEYKEKIQKSDDIQ